MCAQIPQPLELEEYFIESLESQPGGAPMLRQPLLRARCQRSRRLSKAARATAQPGKTTLLLNMAKKPFCSTWLNLVLSLSFLVLFGIYLAFLIITNNILLSCLFIFIFYLFLSVYILSFIFSCLFIFYLFLSVYLFLSASSPYIRIRPDRRAGEQLSSMFWFALQQHRIFAQQIFAVQQYWIFGQKKICTAKT